MDKHYLFNIIEQGKIILFSKEREYLLDYDTYNRAADLFNGRQYKKMCAFLRPYIPLLQEYIGYSYKIGKTIVPIDYALELDPQNPWINGRVVLSVDSRKKSESASCKIKCIRFYPRILFLTTRVIDAVVAHELAHASRFIEGREKDVYNDDWSIDKKKGDWEEFWADREMKKMLRLINPKYNNRLERLATLKAYHQRTERSKVIGFKAIPGQLWDRLMSFCYLKSTKKCKNL